MSNANNNDPARQYREPQRENSSSPEIQNPWRSQRNNTWALPETRRERQLDPSWPRRHHYSRSQGRRRNNQNSNRNNRSYRSNNTSSSWNSWDNARVTTWGKTERRNDQVNVDEPPEDNSWDLEFVRVRAALNSMLPAPADDNQTASMSADQRFFLSHNPNFHPTGRDRIRMQNDYEAREAGNIRVQNPTGRTKVDCLELCATCFINYPPSMTKKRENCNHVVCDMCKNRAGRKC